VYAIYLTYNVPTPAAPTHYEILKSFSTGATGGLVQATGSIWNANYNQDAVFALAFNSILAVNPATNYAQGPGTGTWYCAVQSNYAYIQVNWQTLKVNTGYFAGIAYSSQLAGSDGCYLEITAPYGTASDCWDITGWGGNYGKIDLTGTHYAVNDVFATGGYFGGGSSVFSNNAQVVDLLGQGDCGWIATVEAEAQGTEDAIHGHGGWYLTLERI